MKKMHINKVIGLAFCMLVLFTYGGCKKKKDPAPDNSCQQVVQGDFELVE